MNFLIESLQSTALVHIYADGTVLASHGGMEMGQGLHTKMAQLIAHCLQVAYNPFRANKHCFMQIPIEYVHIEDTSTEKVPNTSPTAGSFGSDLNGVALLVERKLFICNANNERMLPHRMLVDNSTSDYSRIVRVRNLTRRGRKCAKRQFSRELVSLRSVMGGK